MQDAKISANLVCDGFYSCGSMCTGEPTSGAYMEEGLYGCGSNTAVQHATIKNEMTGGSLNYCRCIADNAQLITMLSRCCHEKINNVM